MKINKLVFILLLIISFAFGWVMWAFGSETFQRSKETKSERRIKMTIEDYKRAQELCGVNNVRRHCPESQCSEEEGWECYVWSEATKSATLERR